VETIHSRRVPGETQRVIHNISLGRTDGNVSARTVLSLTPLYNTGYWVKYHVFDQILALCRAIKSTNPIRQLYSSGYSVYSCLIGLVDLIAQLCAMNLAKLLIVSEKN
jgi:hypothetical protein